ncbi:alpha/beta fold hydrolase [Mycobacterium intracellulare]|uniref:alpha/beta fold hydrolase n=1 Tax=Mycobacterium intracellulare TaxID=1767 RepID=UPI001EEEA19D|nr:alpha/beta hydrolase [Mycobacterium intracellulare]MEE3755245.1 alpha/beta hydrolase [Mycobacterium intracellulare]
MAVEAKVRRYTVAADDGIGLAVEDVGPEDADYAVLLSHGWCLGKFSWDKPKRLLNSRFGDQLRILAFDHRGHGHSDPADVGSYTVEQLGSDVAAVLRAAGVRGAVSLVGHSLGAMALLEYLRLPADQRPVDPQGLVLVSTAAGHLADHGVGRLLGVPFLGVLAEVLGHPHHGGDKAARALVRPICRAMTRVCGLCEADRNTLIATVANAVYSTPLSTAAGFLPTLKRFDAYSVLASIHARTVVLSGGADLFTPAPLARDLVAGIAGARHRHLPAAGHMLLHEAPHVVVDEIARTIPVPAVRVGARRQIVSPAGRLVAQS